MPVTVAYASNEFWQDVEEYLRERNERIALACEQHLKQFIADGETHLQSLPPSEQQTRRDEARGNLLRFVDGMIAERKRLGLPELREDTFFAAKRKFCPLWPFC